ncbi:MAG TPA: hypothetical protein PK086_03405 [bacterium]|nr:hypothetical protein [bacterium]
MIGIFVVIDLALLIGLILSSTFRQGVANLVTDITVILFGVTRQYALIAGVTIIVIVSLLFLAIMIGSPIFSGLVFLVAIVCFFVLWLPLGVVLKIFRINNAVVATPVKAFFSWVAFVGFMAMMTPDVFTLKTTLVASLVAIFILMLTSRFNKLVLLLVIIMCFFSAWKLIAPDSFRAVDRHRLAISSLFTTANDRAALRKEAKASSTFGRLIKDVRVVYLRNGSQLAEIPVSLPKGTIVLLCDQKRGASIFQGQSFVEVRLPNNYGSYVNSQCYWLESNLLEIGTMASLTPAEKSSEERHVLRDTIVRDTIMSVSLGPGIHKLQLKPGQIIRLRTTPSKDGCGLLSMSSPTYSYQFKFDGRSWEHDGPAVKYPYMRYPTCLLRSQCGDILTIKVL